MSKLNAVTQKIVEGYKKVESGVVTGYQKVENTVVDNFNKMSDKFVGKFLTKDGESVAQAKERLTEERQARIKARRNAVK